MIFTTQVKSSKTPTELEYCHAREKKRSAERCKSVRKGQAALASALDAGGEQSPCSLRERAIDLAAGRYSQHVFHQALFIGGADAATLSLLILGGAAARFIFKGLLPPDANCFHLHKPPTRRRRESARCPLDKLCHKESGSWVGVYCFTTAAPKAILRRAAGTQRSSLVECAVAAFIIALYNCVTAAWAPTSYLYHLTISREQQLTASNYPLSSRPVTPRDLHRPLWNCCILYCARAFVLRRSFAVCLQAYGASMRNARLHPQTEHLWVWMTTIQMHFTRGCCCACALFFT